MPVITAKNAKASFVGAHAEIKRRAELREKKTAAEDSLRVFIEQAWQVVEPSTPFVGGWNIDAVCEHLEAVSAGHIRNLVINVPPRTAKSLIVSVFWPAWDWIKHPELRWLFSAYTSKLSLRDSMKCRRVIESPWYKANWGDIYHLIGDQNTKENYENNKTGQRIATSVSGIGVGAGGDRIVTDDANNTEEIESELMRQGVLDWWDHTMSTRGNNPKTVARVVIQQRLHEKDLSGHVLEQGGYTHLYLPMRFEINRRCRTMINGREWKDPRVKPGELLWPERFGEVQIQELETRLGSYMAAGQLQQNPSPVGGGMLKSHWWKYWHFRGAKMDPVQVPMPDGSFLQVKSVELPERFDMMIQSWDMAFKDLSTSDYVVGLVLAAKGANRFVLKHKRDHLDMPETVKAVREMSVENPLAYMKLVEDKANGPAVIQSLHAEVGGMIAVNPIGGKIARASAASPEVEAGNWYLPHPQLAPWVDGFIAECAGFPKASYDDQVDAWSQGAARLRHVTAVEDEDSTILRHIQQRENAGWSA